MAAYLTVLNIIPPGISVKIMNSLVDKLYLYKLEALEEYTMICGKYIHCVKSIFEISSKFMSVKAKINVEINKLTKFQKK